MTKDRTKDILKAKRREEKRWIKKEPNKRYSRKGRRKGIGYEVR